MLHVGSGEKWHKLVQYTLNLGIFGLENLALIPGSVGSAAIQNIGAYGIELKDVCKYVDILSLNTSKIIRIYNKQCLFSYRNSIFKHKYSNGFAIIYVGITLKKKWKPILSYPSLKTIQNQKNITPKQIYNLVCSMRKKKIPNPKYIGNAGSFFKNPIINKKKAKLLFLNNRNLPYELISKNEIKISATWLINNSNFKQNDHQQVATYKKNSLILINKKNKATSKDIIQFAQQIYFSVKKKFNIDLEPELCFINSKGKINAAMIIKNYIF